MGHDAAGLITPVPEIHGVIESLDDGRFRLHLGELEREVISGVCRELRELLDSDPEVQITWRLFPTAYLDDADQERFYQQMTRGSLVESRIEALGVVERTADAEFLVADELADWMTAVNSVRLALGTALGITDENIEIGPDDPRIDTWAVYELLSYLLVSIVRTLATG